MASKGEGKIINILNNTHIFFEREKTFKDLKHGLLRYDFYIPNQKTGPIIIEFDGAQHFKFVSEFYKNQQEWKRALEHDRIKNSFCLANNIPLYRIPYWDLENLHTFNDLIKSEYLVKDRWHNDNLRWSHLKK